MIPLLFKNPIQEGIMGLLITLDSFIYGLIGSAFRIFMALASARLLSSDAYYEVANKIYIIVGVLMLFVLAYAILRGVIDPDQTLKGDFGPKMVKNVVIAVIGLAITPVIFNFMYQAQNLFLEHDVLAKIFFRSNSDLTVDLGTSSINVGDSSVPIESNVSVDDKIKQIGGAVTATNLWEAFFHPASDSGLTAEDIEADVSTYFVNGGIDILLCAGLAAGAIALAVTGVGSIFIPLLGGAAVVSCFAGFSDIDGGFEALDILDDSNVTLEEAYAITSGGGPFGIYTVFLDDYIDGNIEYFWGLSTIAGLFVLYAFVSFSIDMGIRAAKMAYYQIIAPVPLIMQVLPNFKSNFNQYVKSVISTFMEVFIRISVVYIVVYIICHLYDLFSTTSAFWGNQDISPVETLIALALLILGLVAFARQAPKFIADSLKLNTGNMSLGIGKKFAEGGGWAAQSIVAAGGRTAAQNWNKNKDQPFGKRLGSALAGFGSAAVRDAYSQFGPGEKHKMAMDHETSKRISSQAVDRAGDAAESRAERKRNQADAASQLEAARIAEETARGDWESAKSALDAAIQSGNAAAIAAAHTALQQARDAYYAAQEATNKARLTAFESTAIGAALQDRYKRATAWATGTIDLSREEADIKFGAALDDMKSKTREEAYKKDAISKAYKQQMEALQATKISEYRDGWNETTYNEEIHRLTETELNDLRAKQSARATAATNLANAQASGASAATIASLQATLTAAETDEETARHALETARLQAVTSLDKVAKRSDSEMAQARSELQVQIESARRTMEAAADAWVAQNITTNQNLQNSVQGVISQFSDYISNNQSRMLTTYDENGNEIKVKLADLLAPFGGDVIKNAKVDFSAIHKANSFVLDEVDASGTVVSHTYKRKYGVDSSGNEIDLGYEYDDGHGHITTISADELFNRAYNSMAKDNSRKIKTQTAVGDVADQGKGVKNATPLTDEYVDKVTRKRQAEENRNGQR